MEDYGAAGALVKMDGILQVDKDQLYVLTAMIAPLMNHE